MDSHEALRIAIGGKTDPVAKYIKYAPNTVYKWQEPRGGLFSGIRNPLDLILDIHEACLELGQGREEVLAPIHYMNAQVGLASYPIPDFKGDVNEIRESFIRTASEFGDVAREIEKSLDPAGPDGGRVTHHEASRMRKELLELIRQSAALAHVIKEAEGDE